MTEALAHMDAHQTQRVQGSTLRVNLWPQASKNSQKQLWASKKQPQLVLQAQ